MPDVWPDMPTAQDLVAVPEGGIRMTDDDVHTWMYLTAPRVRFLKSQHYDAHILDLGAGDGNMEVFRSWLNPVRTDLKMYAVSLDKGLNFDKYEGYELGDYNKAKPAFGGRMFEAIMACHFVEHTDGGPAEFARWAHSRLAKDGRVYVEFPTPHSTKAPRRSEILALGRDVSTLNFHDDKTHLETQSLESTREAFEQAGFFIEESGYVRNPVLEGELLARGARDNDQYHTTTGMWMKTYFSQYLVGLRLETGPASKA